MNRGKLMDKIYANIGYKVKRLAFMSCIVEAIAAVIGGVALLIDYGFEGWWALFIIIGGPIVAWVASWVLYAFGELVDHVCNGSSLQSENTAKDDAEAAKLAEIERENARQRKLQEKEQERMIKQELKLQEKEARQKAKEEEARDPLVGKARISATLAACVIGVVSAGLIVFAIAMIATRMFFAIAVGLVGIALLVMIIPLYRVVFNICLDKFSENDSQEE